ncbi:DUF5829 family protein [Streptomyces sp. ME02-8801-2C]|uniref:DUF5829 family protein n=1 Tax=Streptomyces sp. ME02-8801-2C TaxID=3028680 RepID=UPI0029AA18EB|nr:DUF5829 family protein [Streptomyces sp. ME02-8801-2C]MDX3456875.1 DUF5829 family protein [Streptomyces sp. ME02-8801-2C]
MIIVIAVALAAAVQGGAANAGPAESDQPPPQERQLLYFNHAFGVFDRETADAIEDSAYLREFANFQVRTTTGSGGESWTGRYLYGRETYFELFGVGDVPGQDGLLGSAGTGLSTEHAGDQATVIERLRAEGVTDPVLFPQTRDFGDGVPVPWFDAVLTTLEYDAYDAWSMEYRPEYFADPRGNTEPAAFPGDVGRERYLSDLYREHLMRDVTSVRFAVTARDLAATVPLLRAGGFAVRSVANGGIVARGGGTTIRYDVVTREAGEHTGLRRIEMSLNRPVPYHHEERIGHSTLAVGPGAHAVWTFDDTGDDTGAGTG